jgi:hypothetical protein
MGHRAFWQNLLKTLFLSCHNCFFVPNTACKAELSVQSILFFLPIL